MKIVKFNNRYITQIVDIIEISHINKSYFVCGVPTFHQKIYFGCIIKEKI
jgi:hypothetical protein